MEARECACLHDTETYEYLRVRYDTIRYDTRCYFNVRSKADINSLIYRTGMTTKKCKTEKLKSKNGYTLF